ncbi:Uncharacterised protein [Dorea longicatena]|nr:Uncharacterised protein [Dorea longicatena]
MLVSRQVVLAPQVQSHENKAQQHGRRHSNLTSLVHVESSISEIRIQQTERSCKQCSYNLHQKVNQY